MKTAVLYYTFNGSTKKEAERIAAETGAAVFQIREARDRNIFTAFVPGGFQAMKRKSVRIRALGTDLREYDRIIIGAPVWAGYPAPAFNSALELLPKGKEVELFFCSGGGGTPKSRAGTKELVTNKGCTVVSYRDVTTGAAPGKKK